MSAKPRADGSTGSAQYATDRERQLQFLARDLLIRQLRGQFQALHESLVQAKAAYDAGGSEFALLPADVVALVKDIELAQLEPLSKFLSYVNERVDN